MMWSYIVMVIMASVFSFIRSEQGLPMMDLCATVSGSVCAAMTYRFIKTRNKEQFGYISYYVCNSDYGNC